MKRFIILFTVVCCSLHLSGQQHKWPVFATSPLWIREVGFSSLSVSSYMNFTDETGTTIQNYKAVNAAYDPAGSRVFSVLGTNSKLYVYDNAGVKYVDATSGGTNYYMPHGSGNEIAIVPLPHTCGKIYHVITGGYIYTVNVVTKEIFCKATYGSGVEVKVGHLTATEYPVAVSRLSNNGYFIYHLEGNTSGGGTRYLTTSEVRYCGSVNNAGCTNSKPEFSLNKTQNNISTVYTTSGTPVPTSIQETVSEMEVSPDGNYLSFADVTNVLVFNVNSTGITGSLYYHYRYNFSPQSPFVGGVEFNATSTKLFCLRADNATVPSASALLAIDLGTSSGSVSSVSPLYTRSFLELARDGKIYMTEGTNLLYVDESTNTLVGTGTACPVKMNTNFPTTQLKTLPDQVDGFTVSTSYLSPTYALDDIVMTHCIGATINIEASRLQCLSGTSSAVTWSGTHVSDLLDGNVLEVMEPGGYEFTAEITSAYGCVLKQKVIVNVPAVTEETVDKYYCYGEPLEMPVTLNPGCPSTGETKWYEFNTATGKWDNTYFHANPTYSFSQVPAQTRKIKAICFDENHCATKITYYNIYVSDPPFETYQVFDICFGGTVTLLQSNYCLGIGGTNPVADWHGPYTDDGMGHILLGPAAYGNLVYVDCLNPFMGTSKLCPTLRTHIEVRPFAFAATEQEYTICEGDDFNFALLIEEDPSPGHPINFTCHYEALDADGNTVLTYPVGSYPSVGAATGVYRYKKVCTSPEGCYLEIYYRITRETTSTYQQTINISCNQTVDLDDYNTNGCTDVLWSNNNSNPHTYSSGGATASLYHIQTVSSSTTFYGFGRDAAGNCCKIILHFEVPQPVVRYRELCFNGTPITMDNSWFCPSGTNCTWYVDGVAQGAGFTVGSGNVNSNIHVECTDPVTGCLLYKTIFTFVQDPNCEQEIFCFSETLTLHALCPDGTVTIEWYKNGSLYATNQPTLVVNPPSGPDPSAAYIVLCKDASGAVLKEKRYFIIDCNSPQRFSAPKKRPGDKAGKENQAGHSGMSKAAAENMLRIYPNPSAGVFSVDMQGPGAAEMNIEVYNVMGQIILTKTGTGNTSIDLREQPAGTYMVKVNTGGEDFFRKVVVIRN